MNFFQTISLLAIFGVACLSASAQMQITVGRGGIPWESICDSSSFVQIKPDSIWVWPTSKGENLIPESRQRGGGVYVFAPRPMQVNPDEFLEMQTLIATEIANDLIDGDLVSLFLVSPADGYSAVIVESGGFRVEVQFVPIQGDSTSYVVCEVNNGVNCTSD
mgnify:CR=1 FL=1